MANGIYTSASLRFAENVSTFGFTPAIVGQKVSSGTASSGAVYEITTSAEADALYGANSILALKVRKFYESFNEQTKILTIGVNDNGSGVAATSTITFAGTPTSNGTATIRIGGTGFEYTITYLTTDTATTLAAQLVATITADTKALITATNLAGVVTLTARNKGTEMNRYPIDASITVIPGITVTPTAFAGGSVDPVATGLFSPLSNVKCAILAPFFARTALESFLDTKLNEGESLYSSYGYIYKSATESEINAEALSTTKDFNINLVVIFDHYTTATAKYFGSDTALNSIFEVASSLLATQVAQLSEGKVLDNYKIVYDAYPFIKKGEIVPNIGGKKQIARPFNEDILLGIVPTPSSVQLNSEMNAQEKQFVRKNGITMTEIDDTKTRVVCQGTYTVALSTYNVKINERLFLNQRICAVQLREDIQNELKKASSTLNLSTLKGKVTQDVFNKIVSIILTVLENEGKRQLFTQGIELDENGKPRVNINFIDATKQLIISFSAKMDGYPQSIDFGLTVKTTD